jgi:hypothetical protein
MAPRDYEMEDAVAAVIDRVSESITRALLVQPPGALHGTMGGALRGLFGKRRRASGLNQRNVLVLTPTSVQLFACEAHGWPPRAVDDLGAWPVDAVRIATVAKETHSTHSVRGSMTAKYYVITLTVPGAEEPIELECPRTDSARETILAIEDATGSPPSKVTARRRAKRAREGEASA